MYLDRSVALGGRRHAFQIYLPPAYDGARGWPLILFLHGAGERGADGQLPSTVGIGPALRRHPDRYPGIVVFPQAPAGTRWSDAAADVAVAALSAAENELAVDRSRTYLTGISLGGNGALALANACPDRFAALVIVCAWVTATPAYPGVFPPGTPDPFGRLAARLRGTPMRIYHGSADPVVPVEQSRRLATALQDVGADATYVELDGTGHAAWDAAYMSEELPAWLFTQRKRGIDADAPRQGDQA